MEHLIAIVRSHCSILNKNVTYLDSQTIEPMNTWQLQLKLKDLKIPRGSMEHSLKTTRHTLPHERLSENIDVI